MIEAGSKDIPIGRLLCIIVENAEDVAKFADFTDSGDAVAAAPAPPPPAPKAAPPAAAATTAAAPAKPAMVAPTTSPSRPVSGDRPFASPAAKKAAAERGIHLFKIKSGSGMDGMIPSRDVENFKAPAAASALTTGFPLGDLSYADVETSNIRKVIAKRLQQSKHEIPHYYLTVECSMDSIMKLRSEINS